MKNRRRLCLKVLLIVTLGFVVTIVAFAQSTAFTYQGKLTDSGNLANGQYDFQFKLFDTQTIGTGVQQGSPVAVANITVTAGVFTVLLDFGACASCFNGAARFLEIAVKPTSGSTFTTLSPRQPINSTPYAIKSQNAASADGLTVACVNCITNSQIGSVNGSAVTGSIPVASVPAGSDEYIQNGTSQQATSNFNISGNGTALTLSASEVNANSGFKTGGQWVLISHNSGLFAGLNAGTATGGAYNAFFGNSAGEANTSGNSNAFFGVAAGQENTIGNANSFFGRGAGYHSTGSYNTFAGWSADFESFGNPAAGNNNTLLGAFAAVTPGLSNATAIGSAASVTQSNSVVLGSITNINGGTDTNVGIGTTAPQSRLEVVNTEGTQVRFGDTTADNGGYLISTTSTQAILSGGAKFEGANWIAKSTSASRIDNLAGTTRFFTNAGLTAGSTFTPTERMRITSTGDVGIGTFSPDRHLHIFGTGDQEIGIESSDAGGRQWTLQSASGASSGRFEIIDRTAIASRMTILSTGLVGIGTTTPADRLDVNGDVRVGTGTTGCVKDSDGTVIAGTCSSDARLKRDITPFPQLLDKLAQLQPVHFYWRTDEFPDRHLGSRLSFGLIAQEVEKTMPELVTNDENGFKVVRYNELPFLILQAIRELKTENDSFRAQIKEQERQAGFQRNQLEKQQAVIDGLKHIVCADHPAADLCK